jgi:excinuclease ABC subunit A
VVLPTADSIQVRGARQHNLRNLNVDIPRDRLTVITGLSGSGKSSLAHDTIFAEGQRRYVESLSTFARMFIEELERPDIDLIDGLPPTITVAQDTTTVNPRSTVATVTEVYDHLRLLFARAGSAHCWRCGTKIGRQTPDQIVDAAFQLQQGQKLMVLAPIVRGRKGQHRDVMARILRDGFIRARVDTTLLDLNNPPDLDRNKPHTIEAVIDRLVVRDGLRPRLAESITLALKHGSGSTILTHLDEDGWHDRIFSTQYACPNCDTSFDELAPRNFSFNSPYGACPECDGLGVIVHEEAADRGGSRQAATLCPACNGERLRPEARAVTIAGTTIHAITAMTIDGARRFIDACRRQDERDPTMEATTGAVFNPQQAIIARPILAAIQNRLDFLDQVGLGYLTLHRSAATLSGGEAQRIRLAAHIGSGVVGVCYVLDEPTIGLHQRDNDRLIAALHRLRDAGNTVVVIEHDEEMMRASDHIVDLGPGAGRQGGEIVAAGPVSEFMTHATSLTARFLRGELTIPMPESSRPIDLKNSIQLKGVRTNNLCDIDVRFPLSRLIAVTGVSGSGKSSLVAETLAPALRRAIATAGAPRQNSLFAEPNARRSRRTLRSNRLDSSETAAVEADRSAKRLPSLGAARFASISGAERIDKLIEIDQSPIGRTPRSTPATYIGLLGEIRQVFAETRDAKVRGYKSGRFSPNVRGGRCEQCEGLGVRKIEMHFLPDMHVVCEVCRGKRFNSQTLEIRYRNHTIGDVFDMRIDDAVEFFENFPHLSRKLATLHDVGLGYITLGQSSTTLSGGEAQRIKLAAELSRVATGRTFYVLDEPTTGLHFADIEHLLAILQRLVDRGNTVLVIEHHMDVIKTADYVIDLGPDGGDSGGQLVVAGTPVDVANCEASYTGRYLRTVLQKARPI